MGSNTLRKIKAAAQTEFLEKGFKDASLRNIVKQAGVTTGAFYGYFKSKDVLLDALVKEPYDYLMGLYCRAMEDFKKLSQEEQRLHMGDTGYRCMMQMLEYAYQNMTAFQLLFRGTSGTKYEDLIHQLVELEIRSTHAFIAEQNQGGVRASRMNPYLEHTIISGMFTSFFELIIHEVPIQEARACVKQIHAFYTAGWLEIMEL